MTVTIPMVIMVITVIIRIAESKPHRFPRNFVSIVDWKGRKVNGGGNIGSFRGTPGTAPPQSRLLPAAVAPHGEPQFLRHLGAEALPVVHRILPAVPAELQDGDHDGEGETAEQHDEHSANVLHTERVGLGVLALVLHTVVIVTAPAAGRSSREGGRGFR